LLRWNHPKLGFVPPSEFIPIAEETGLIGDLGAFAARTACRAALEWQEAAGRPIVVAINKSPKEFAIDNGFAKWRAIIVESGLPKGLIGVEITENVRLIENNTYLSLLEEMRTKGYSISLDDFGTGYSSLGYLRSLPVDMVKIDQSFIADLERDTDKSMLVDVILSITKRLALGSVAEGIETAAQRDYLIAAGCQYGQGYFFSRSVSHQKLLKLLESPPAEWWR
jgi:EAL domain-containing protein (putative c-di-GMP-specific phosphodiesterase class I)